MTENFNAPSNEPLPKSKTVLAILMTVIITAIIIGGGVLLWQWGVINQIKNAADNKIAGLQQQFQQQINGFQSQLTQLGVEKSRVEGELNQLKDKNNPANWKVYNNDFWNFSFKHPDDWTIIEDKAPKNASETIYGESGAMQSLLVGINSNNLKPTPSLKIWIDPTGFGPFFPNKRFDVQQTENGFSIIKEEQQGENADPDLYQILVSDSGQTGQHKFFMLANQAMAEQLGWDDTVKAILATFQFAQ
jgi:hypothetical protein